jgi:hypothetical protein
MRNVWIGTVTFVILVLLRLCHAAEFSCAAGDVACLRAAINAANGNGEANTLTLGAGTYTVTAVDNLTDGANGLPSIYGTLTIRRAAPPITVEREVTPSGASEEGLVPRAMPPAIVERAAGAPFFRLFHVAATGNLTLDGLTFAGGNIVGDGGGLRNRGRVVMHSTLTDNAADYGGGLSNEGALTITDSAIVRSRAHAGAGILNRGALIVVNTTIADNAANEGEASPIWAGALWSSPMPQWRGTRRTASLAEGALPIWASARWSSRTPSSPSIPPLESSVRIVSGGSSRGVIICSGTR